MSDSASDARKGWPVQPSGGADGLRGERSASDPKPAVPPGEQATTSLPPPILVADQPTIVTGREPVSVPTLSDAIRRILNGHVTPGDRLGHFELVEYVGGGGMGRVFRALVFRLVPTASTMC